MLLLKRSHLAWIQRYKIKFLRGHILFYFSNFATLFSKRVLGKPRKKQENEIKRKQSECAIHAF